jgi:RimJ/RimL family protein N-acetyltransferase
MVLRDVVVGDVDVYVRMRCDPVMMADLGGPLPRDGMEDKVARDVELARQGRAFIKMIVLDDVVAGSVTMWTHAGPDGAEVAEIGWMVLPEFQGRGIGKRAVRSLLELGRGDERYAHVHAFPAVANGPSNGICGSLGFELLGEEEFAFAGRQLLTNHWVIHRAVESRPTARSADPDRRSGRRESP